MGSFPVIEETLGAALSRSFLVVEETAEAAPYGEKLL